MTRPARASTARRLTRSPEPRRARLWLVSGRWVFPDTTVYLWRCYLCESGTGQAPTHKLADQAAATHWRAAHTNQEARA